MTFHCYFSIQDCTQHNIRRNIVFVHSNSMDTSEGKNSISNLVSRTSKFSKRKLWFWRSIALLCIIPGWVVSTAPIPPLFLTESFPRSNISQNQMLLDKLNLSNVTVLCPEGYTFSRMEQRCSTVCGYYDNYPLPLTISKRVLLSAIAVINTGVTILAIYRLIRYRKEYKFQHHPIFVGVFVNLIQAIFMGVPDILGANIFFCESQQITYNRLDSNPTIQLHIHGASLRFLSLSNRLWFVMALVLIFLATFPLKDIYRYKWNRITIVLVEIGVCLIFPLICAFVPFVPFSGYRLFQYSMITNANDRMIEFITNLLPQQLIGGLTLTVIVLIVYRIHSQLQIGSSRTGKRIGIQPIEKRLIFFSVLYFALNSIISLSIIIITIFNNSIRTKTSDYASYLTLNSPYSSRGIPSNGMNKTLSLLSSGDQLLIQYRNPFFILFVHDLSIRSLFILVLSVLNFSCSKPKLCSKKVINNTQSFPKTSCVTVATEA